MANPSTEGGSGAGTEVLRRQYVEALSNSEVTILTGVLNHIYTILSVTFCETAGAAEVFHLYVDRDNSGNNVYLLSAQALAADETFIWNDKFVMSGTDRLHSITTSSANIDLWCSYIDQDWT